MEPAREVICGDAFAWLDQTELGPSQAVVTSLPDSSELGHLSFEAWRAWFSATSERLCRQTHAEAVTLFYQTDVKREGTWVDKAYLVQRGAEAAGAQQLWHKVVCRAAPGTTTFGRPAYAHLLAFSRGLRVDPGRSTPDVLPTLGEMTWSRAMGLEACRAACRFVLEQTPCRVVVDPFCGVGSVLAVANAMGLAALGVERSAKRCEKARRLSVTLGPTQATAR